MNPCIKAADRPLPPAVYFYGTCLIDLFDPQAGLSAIELIERLGIRVVFPDAQSCCGQPAYTSGYPDEALAVAETQLALFGEDWPIVVASGSCAGMICHHWPRLFGADHPRTAQVAAVAARTYEFTQFLVEVCGVSLQDQGAQSRVVLHTSCSARREMGVHLTSQALLGQLTHVEVIEQERAAECCGFGGTFSVRQPELSAAMAGDKAASLVASGADLLVSADCGCLANINGTLAGRGATLRGQHIATFIKSRLEPQA
jgi:L-lactate dehydrogenase complex protein LldE